MSASAITAALAAINRRLGTTAYVVDSGRIGIIIGDDPAMWFDSETAAISYLKTYLSEIATEAK